tara:strand:+ start:742 stop:1158 length:417 start_codon:yes stop_codon:yes gene_type:complete
MSKTKEHTNPMHREFTPLPAKNTKPRSELQQVQAQANWAIYFKLQPFHSFYTDKLSLSSITKDYIDQYNEITAKLKDLIAMEAEWTKHRIKERQDEEAEEAAKLDTAYLTRDSQIKRDFDMAAKSIHDDCYKQSTGTG